MTVDKWVSEMSWHARPDEQRRGKFQIKLLYLCLDDLPLEEASGVNDIKLGTPSFFPVNAPDHERPHTPPQITPNILFKHCKSFSF